MKYKDSYIQVIVFAICFFLAFGWSPENYPVVELGLAIICFGIYSLLSAASKLTHQPNTSLQWVERWAWAGHLVVFTVSAYFFPICYYFIPSLFFEVDLRQWRSRLLLVIPIVLGLFLKMPVVAILLLSALTLFVTITVTIIDQSDSFEVESYEEIDTLRNINSRIKVEQEQLLSLQDERVKASQLAERRRLVGEIHDLLGHQLSSAVIQIGALEYVVEDEAVKEQLGQVKEVLNTSMTNVRSIIHTERQTTINLETELEEICANFTKCPIHFSYTNSIQVTSQVAHSIVNIVKEALTNINKHSDATQVQLVFNQLDSQWTLLIADNGSQKTELVKPGTGIGLLNIEERVEQIGGNLYITTSKGFRIFIRIPIVAKNVLN